MRGREVDGRARLIASAPRVTRVRMISTVEACRKRMHSLAK